MFFPSERRTDLGELSAENKTTIGIDRRWTNNKSGRRTDSGGRWVEEQTVGIN